MRSKSALTVGKADQDAASPLLVRRPAAQADPGRIGVVRVADGRACQGPVQGPDPFAGRRLGNWTGMEALTMVQAGRRLFERLRSGVPLGGPDRPYLSVLALLARRLSDEEVDSIVARLPDGAATLVDNATIGTLIMEITHELPSQDDVARVRARTVRRT